MPIAELMTLFAPVGAGVGLVTISGLAVYKEHKRRKARIVQLKQEALQAVELKERLPAGTVYVQQGAIPRRKDKRTNEDMPLSGTTMLVSNGTPGANRLLDILIALARAGLSDSIGSILVWEGDTPTRHRMEASLPEVFRSRTVFAAAPEYASGFGNMSPAEVEARIAKWSVPLASAIDQVDSLHEERTQSKPGEIVLLTSLGGHAFCGVFIAQELRKRLPETPIIGFLNLPKKETQRDYFADLKPRFDAAGVNHWVVSDQMQPDWVQLDLVVSDLFVGLTAASTRSETSPRINNIARNATSRQPGGIARYEYRYSDVVAHRHPADPTQPLLGYYVYIEQVKSELRTLIEHGERGECAVSLAVPTGEAKCQTYDLAIGAIHPNHMLDVRDYIEETRESEDQGLAHQRRPHLHPQPNYETIYTVWAPPIDPERPRCRLAVIRICPVSDPHGTLSEIVKVPAKRQPATIPQPATANPSTNGVVLVDDFDQF